MDLTELKELRKQKRIKIGELVKITGISRNVISRIENGKGNPTYANVVALINALNLDLALLTRKKQL